MKTMFSSLATLYCVGSLSAFVLLQQVEVVTKDHVSALCASSPRADLNRITWYPALLCTPQSRNAAHLYDYPWIRYFV